MEPNEIKDHSMVLRYWAKQNSVAIKKVQELTRETVKPVVNKTEIVNDFMKNVEIVGIKKQGEKIYIGIKDKEGARLIELEEAHRKFPSQLATFYESKIVLTE